MAQKCGVDDDVGVLNGEIALLGLEDFDGGPEVQCSCGLQERIEVDRFAAEYQACVRSKLDDAMKGLQDVIGPRSGAERGEAEEADRSSVVEDAGVSWRQVVSGDEI